MMSKTLAEAIAGMGNPLEDLIRSHMTKVAKATIAEGVLDDVNCQLSLEQSKELIEHLIMSPITGASVKFDELEGLVQLTMSYLGQHVETTGFCSVSALNGAAILLHSLVIGMAQKDLPMELMMIIDTYMSDDHLGRSLINLISMTLEAVTVALGANNG